MSERKPPPRPPPPRQTAKAGQTSTQGRFRDAFASISIRYSNTSKDSDSDEEISIVRKAEESSPDVQENDLDDKEGEAVEVTTTCRPEVGNVATNGLNREGKLRPVHSKSLQETEYRSHESKTGLSTGAVSKRKSWPVAAGSSANHLTADQPGMKFLRGREQNSRSDEALKVQVSLSEKEESDPSSQPPKSHLQAADNEMTASKSRSRSPSPFRRFRQDATQKKSGISLSSLLAADRKSESDSDSEVEEHFLDTLSEPPSPERSKDKAKPERDSFTSKGKGLRRGSRVADKGPDFSTFCLCTVVVYIYYISTPPPFFSGLFMGVIFTYLAGCLFLWLFSPQDTIAERFQREMLEYEDRLASMSTPEYRSVDPGLLLGIRELKGWMYKAYDYKPENFDFNSETTPVLAFLKGTKLTLSHPDLLNSTKRFDPRTVEDDTSISFSRHELFDISGSSVSLLPPSLTLKRLWSKKFPIYLELGKPGANTEETSASVDEEGEKTSLEKTKFHKSFEDIEKLYLFARTGREKEEWYNHLCKTLNPEITTSDLDEILRPSCSYPHYMARLLPLADSKLQQAQIAWVNVLFGRAFWDVWQSHYWADKVRQRFQNKLSKMRKPQFIKDISIADLSLGHSLPVINRASPPVVDERGTWVDLDVTYSGGLVFTLEGHLNVEGYLRYFIDLGRGGNSGDVAADLEMTELQRKYDLEEDEESVIVTAKNANKDEVEEDVESESPPLSDSDFESPESDLEEFASEDCQSLPSSPLLSPKMDVFHNAIESSTGSEDAVDAKAQNGAHFFPSSSGPEEQIRSSSDEPDSGKQSPLSSPGKGPEKQMDSSPSGASRMTQVDLLPKTGAKKKIFGVIERLAKSKWVKKAVETDLVKRAAEKFSNVPIILSVEVQAIKGTLALNIPPPPTNRLWYGFRGHPMLFVSARPKLGERQVKLTHVTDWIEKKLKHEFKNMFVLPNMEDLPIKLMNSGFEGQCPEQ